MLCEKPMSRRRADAQRVVDARPASAGCVVSEAFMYRHHPQIVRLRELVARAARSAQLRAVRAHFSFNLTEPGNVRLSAELDGGALMDVGCYCLNATRLLGRRARAGQRAGGMSGDGVDMRFAASDAMPGGVLAHFDCGFDFVFATGSRSSASAARSRSATRGMAASPRIVVRTDDGASRGRRRCRRPLRA